MRIFLQSKLTTIILVLALVWLGGSVIAVYRQAAQVQEEQRDLQAKIAALERDNATLQEQINRSSDPEYLEWLAKVKLNYRPADEQVAFIYPAASPEPASKSFDEEPSGVAKYWSWLKGLFE
ncbi:MAG: septum formation initiator family protein [Patescibacteria group bacterium]